MTPFKFWINPASIKGMAYHFAKHDSKFDPDLFQKLANQDLDKLELKQRTGQVTAAMSKCLPADFAVAAEIIQQSLAPPLGEAISGGSVTTAGIGGWSTMALADYVALHRHSHFVLALETLQAITRRGSVEFAIRPFLRDQQTRTLQALEGWLGHPDHHVRRLVSEGTRPLLPWGFKLTALSHEPALVLPLLNELKDDPSLYVRRSVANHLNDISKAHPELVVNLASQWWQALPQRQQLLRHACRTLLKQDHPEVLHLFGYSQVNLKYVQLVNQVRVPMGGCLEFGLTITLPITLPETLSNTLLSNSKSQALMLDYELGFQKANGNLGWKVFKWRKVQMQLGQTLVFKKSHSFKPITTRRYYPGLHELRVKVNGQVIAKSEFNLD